MIIATDVGRNCKVMEKNKRQVDNVQRKSQRRNTDLAGETSLGKNVAWLGRKIQSNGQKSEIKICLGNGVADN